MSSVIDLTIESPAVIDLTGNKENRKRKIGNHNGQQKNSTSNKRKVRSIESFLTSDRRRTIAAEIEDMARETLENDRIAGEACHKLQCSPLIHIQKALFALRGHGTLEGVVPEAIDAAMAQIRLCDVQFKLVAEKDEKGCGVPLIVCNAMVRRILAPESQPIVIYQSYCRKGQELVH